MQPGAAYDKGVRKAQQTGSYNDMQPAHVRTAGGRCEPEGRMRAGGPCAVP